MTESESRIPETKPFSVGNLSILPGRSVVGELPIAKLVTGTQISLPLQVYHGKSQGRVIWLSAAVHGDEIAGVEIIRRITESLIPKKMSGTLIAVPIVNVHGFLNGDRYFPDRRDLNRSFPGSANGSLAARVANLFMTEIVSRCDVGIDLHTGSDHRVNLPQIRANMEDAETRELSRIFAAPVTIHAKVRDGSLRGAATESGCKVLLYEGGEAWRFDRQGIETGVQGIRRVLSNLGMLAELEEEDAPAPLECTSTYWIRARKSGIILLNTSLGDEVSKGESLGIIHDSVGKKLSQLRSPRAGIVIGQIQHPLVNQGDAVIHIAEVGEQ